MKLGQPVAVLGAAAAVAVAGIAFHQATRERQAAPKAASPTFVVPAAVLKGPGAAIAWLDNLTGVDPNGHLVGPIPAQVVLRSADGDALYALGDQKISVYGAASG